MSLQSGTLLAPNLHAFMAIVAAGTVHGAASQLFITQTAVTQRLKSLEEKLQVSLFVRSRRGMRLTPEGEVLHRYCQSVEALGYECLDRISQSGVVTHIPFTLGGPTSVLQSRVVPVIAKLMKKYPAVLFSLHYQDDTDEEMIDLLKNGKIQLAIISAESVTKEMCVQVLAPASYILVASKNWQQRKLNDIIDNERIIDFNQRDKTTFSYLRHYNLLSKSHIDRYYANHPEAMLQFIKDGCAYSVLEKSFAEPYLQRGELIALNQGKVYEDPISLVWYERPNLPEYFVSVLTALSSDGDNNEI